jgi:hypothetical protein
VTSAKFITKDGTSTQFVKGDGSLDSNTYALSSSLGDYLPLAGGTMKKDAYISWNASEYGDSVSDWSTITGHGLRIISSTSENSKAPTTYCTALHVKGSYGFKLAA